MTRLRTLYERDDALRPDTEEESDLKLITLLAALVATAVTGCSPSDSATYVDAAPDRGKVAPDASTASEGGARDGTPEDDDDAPRGIIVLPAQFVEENTPLRMLAAGDPIELWPAPQGGHVVLIGAKVKNFAGDTALLRVRARYPDTPFIIAEEARAVKLVPVPGEPDTLQPELTTRTQVAHIPLCPDYDPMDIVDRPLEFMVQVTPLGMNEPSGTATLNLYPSCVSGKVDVPFCRCECSANYVLGKCKRDAGPRN